MAISKQIVNLDWHIVCGSMEIEELAKYKKIIPWNPRNHRHSLFMAIKYPNTDFYKGNWGQEILHFVDDGPYRGQVGKIFCTYNRYIEIARWFLLNVFQP